MLAKKLKSGVYLSFLYKDIVIKKKKYNIPFEMWQFFFFLEDDLSQMWLHLYDLRYCCMKSEKLHLTST